MSDQLLDAIISKDAIKINDAFSTQITKHIQRVLDDKRKEIGKTIFSENETNTEK